MHRPASGYFLLVLLVLCALGAVHAREMQGVFGFIAKVDADGIFSPTLKSVRVQSVQPGMPAAAAGMVAGDHIVAVNGIQVAGAKASAMASQMKKRPGESVQLKLLRASGETQIITLTAVAAKR